MKNKRVEEAVKLSTRFMMGFEGPWSMNNTTSEYITNHILDMVEEHNKDELEAYIELFLANVRKEFYRWIEAEIEP